MLKNVKVPRRVPPHFDDDDDEKKLTPPCKWGCDVKKKNLYERGETTGKHMKWI